jgi:PadR family transcriptional regulator PadR
MGHKRELLKGSTDSLLLTIIADGSMYGYQLIKEMERRSAGYFRFGEGTLYLALHRLEKDGLIQGKWERSPTGKERRYYHLTQKGLRMLAEMTAEWHRFSDAVNMVIEPADY